MTLEEIGHKLNEDPRDAAMDIAIADHGNSAQVISIMEESDVRTPYPVPL